MLDQLQVDISLGQRYALCVGIGQYTELQNRDLRYAVSDAQAIAAVLQDQRQGQFEVTLLTEPSQTTKTVLEKSIDHILNGRHLNTHDLVVIYISCHGSVYGRNNTFYLLPSNAGLEQSGMPKKTTVIDIHDLAKTLTNARVKNIIFFLDACYSGGAGGVLEQLDLSRDLTTNTNLFIIGAARHDQIALQESSVSHGVFTYCLLRAFGQRPKRNDGWITITDISTFVADDIKNFGQGTTQIQGISAFINPNIPFIKNPQYSPQNQEFAQAVQKLLQLVQYEPLETTLSEVAPAGFYVATIKSGILTRKVGIIPYFNEIESILPEHIESIVSFVKAQVERGNLHEALLVTAFEVSDELRQTIKIHSLEILSYEDIWKNLIDFRKYLNYLIRDYETPSKREDAPPLSKVYVPLIAEYHSYRKIDRKRVSPRKPEEGHEIVWRGDAQKAVESWLADQNSSRMALLADYGTGKTTFCQHLASTLSKKLLESSKSQRYRYRLPLLIPLLEFSKSPVDLGGFLVAYLKQRCKVDNPDFDALMKMAEAGLLLFILDGFDEMASRASADTIRQNIVLFDQLARLPKNKVLLTTRPEYFTSLSQELDVLWSYDRLYLQLFDEKQIDLYLQKRVPFITHPGSNLEEDWKIYRQQIDGIHDLSDLARRPVLLEMIIKTLPKLLNKGEFINRPNLYQRYLEGELERQHYIKQRRDLQINIQKRFEIMEQLALELYRSSQVELSSRRILEISKELLTEDQHEELEGSLREIITCSFLIRKNDRYRFSHQSFLEYLVARHLAKNISENDASVFQLKLINWTTLGFLIELEKGYIQGSSTTGQADSERISYNTATLIEWLHSSPRKKWISTNAIDLLARLLPHDSLCKLPLSHMDLSNAMLNQVDLRGANLSGTNLSGAKLQRSNLRGAQLGGANLDMADLELADLSHADLHDASLTRANFSYTNLIGANLAGADLLEAKLDTAYLKDAKGVPTNIKTRRGTDHESILH